MPSELPAKEHVAQTLLLRGVVLVHLDPRVDGVTVPGWLADQAQLVLSIGLDLPIPIPDLRVDTDGVFGTLSFGGSPFACSIPWRSVFALVGDDGKGMVWPEDIPLEIAAEMERSKRPRLRAVKGGADAPAPEASVEEDAPATASEERDAEGAPVEPGRRGHLRLVK